MGVYGITHSSNIRRQAKVNTETSNKEIGIVLEAYTMTGFGDLK